MEPMKAMEARARLKREGWVEERKRKHITLTHPDKPDATIVMVHGRNTLSPGVMREIARTAGWKWPPR